MNSSDRPAADTQEMREWLEWKRSDFLEYDVEANTRPRASASANLPPDNELCPFW